MSSKPPPSPFLLVGMGLTIAVCVTACMGLGYLVGNALGASVVCIFVGLAAGIATAAATVRAEFKRYM